MTVEKKRKNKKDICDCDEIIIADRIYSIMILQS